MIFDTITALADYLNNGKFDNSASRAQCEDALREFLRTDHETLTVDGRIILNNEGKRLSYFVEEIQHRTPRSEYEQYVSNYESSSSSSGTGVPTGPFKLEATIASPGQSLRLYYADAVNFTVDWGDGNVDVVQDGTFLSYIEHVYSNSGVYTINLSGQTSWFSINDPEESDPYIITKILTPVIGITGLTNLNSAFYRTGITEIPSDLFDYVCENVTDFGWIFDSCANLMSIPIGLFDNCSNATSLRSVFRNCTSLTSIPSGLFDNCPNATNFRSCFGYCDHLLSIPNGLFDNCPNVTDFGAAFTGCSNLASIPNGLFDNCPNVTAFYDLFNDCTDLASIPNGLFDNCLNIEVIYQAFANCINLTGLAPELWWRIPSPTNGNDCFLNCTQLDNYAYIPVEWGGLGEIVPEYAPNMLFTLSMPSSDNFNASAPYYIGATVWESGDNGVTKTVIPTYLNQQSYNADWKASWTSYYNRIQAQFIRKGLDGGSVNSNVISLDAFDGSSLIAYFRLKDYRYSWYQYYVYDSMSFWNVSNYSPEYSRDIFYSGGDRLFNDRMMNGHFTVGSNSLTVSWERGENWPPVQRDPGLEPVLTTQIKVITGSDRQCISVGYADAKNLRIDWGDGKIDIYKGGTVFETYALHIYSSADEYTIKVSGETSWLAFNDLFQGLITEILTPIQGITGLTTLRYAFSTLYGLTSLPSDLFYNCVNVTDFSKVFRSCTNLTSTPSGLFNNCINAENFNEAFSWCEHLVIPNGLFDSCINVTDFGGVFRNCDITSIPTGLFDNCPNVIDFTYAFVSCGVLASIPTGLFDSCINVTDFDSVFRNCLSLETIPSGLFDYNVNVTSFSEVFRGCVLLTSIPSGLFDNNILVTTFDQMFTDCPELTSIPSGLFDNNTIVEDFRYTFANCLKLTDIPSGLFDNNTAMTTFNGTFSSCNKLTAIPAGLFDNNLIVTDFSYAFYQCSELTGVAPELWLRELPNGWECFSSCVGLTEWNYIPSNWGGGGESSSSSSSNASHSSSSLSSSSLSSLSSSSSSQ